MASNETRARLMGRRIIDFFGYECAPLYDDSRDACAELLEYVRERGRIEVFIHHVSNKSSYQNFAREIEHMWNGLTATPPRKYALHLTRCSPKNSRNWRAKDGK